MPGVGYIRTKESVYGSMILARKRNVSSVVIQTVEGAMTEGRLTKSPHLVAKVSKMLVDERGVS